VVLTNGNTIRTTSVEWMTLLLGRVGIGGTVSDFLVYTILARCLAVGGFIRISTPLVVAELDTLVRVSDSLGVNRG